MAAGLVPTFWICNTCTFKNLSTKQNCVMCNTTRLTIFPASPVANTRTSSPTPLSLSWKCTTCQALNKMIDKNCRYCTANSPHTEDDKEYVVPLTPNNAIAYPATAASAAQDVPFSFRTSPKNYLSKNSIGPNISRIRYLPMTPGTIIYSIICHGVISTPIRSIQHLPNLSYSLYNELGTGLPQISILNAFNYSSRDICREDSFINTNYCKTNYSILPEHDLSIDQHPAFVNEARCCITNVQIYHIQGNVLLSTVVASILDYHNQTFPSHPLSIRCFFCNGVQNSQQMLALLIWKSFVSKLQFNDSTMIDLYTRVVSNGMISTIELKSLLDECYLLVETISHNLSLDIKNVAANQNELRIIFGIIDQFLMNQFTEDPDFKIKEIRPFILQIISLIDAIINKDAVSKELLDQVEALRTKLVNVEYRIVSGKPGFGKKSKKNNKRKSKKKI